MLEDVSASEHRLEPFSIGHNEWCNQSPQIYDVNDPATDNLSRPSISIITLGQRNILTLSTLR